MDLRTSLAVVTSNSITDVTVQHGYHGDARFQAHG